MLKNLPANVGNADSILGRGDPLQKEMVTYSNILAWRIPWTEEAGSLQSMGSQKRQDLATKQQWHKMTSIKQVAIQMFNLNLILRDNENDVKINGGLKFWDRKRVSMKKERKFKVI